MTKAQVLLAALAIATFDVFEAQAAGPDVILGFVDRPVVLAEDGLITYLGAATTSCNAGDQTLDWMALPDNRHPVIALALYRLADGKLEQLGQSWLKHGFATAEADECNLGCRPAGVGNRLGPGCSDPYGARMNSGPDLGSRGEVNPVTGHYDGSTANNHQSHRHTSPLHEHSLQVPTAALNMPGAEYIIEGQYVTADDAKAGNGLNNVSYRKLKLGRDSHGRRIFLNGGDVVRAPAITAWAGAAFTTLDTPEATVEGRPLLARVIFAAKVGLAQSGRRRYDIAVYNMNSARGLRALRLALGGATVVGKGESAVPSHGEPWSNAPWESKVENGQLEWSVKSFADDQNANALRWGTTYSFWFEVEAGSPAPGGDVTIEKFTPGEGPSILTAKLPLLPQ